MSEQRKLKFSESNDCQRSASALLVAFNWARSPEGAKYWQTVHKKLAAMATHGTSDGKPYVEPIRIPADEDAKERPMVMVSEDGKAWTKRKLLAVVSSQTPYITESTMIGATRWRYCRFPTEAELREMEQ